MTDASLPPQLPHLSRRQRRRQREAQLQAPAMVGLSESTRAIDAVAEAVARANTSTDSKQPRFQGGRDAATFLASVMTFIRRMDLEPPPTTDPRKLDEWYRAFAFRESHLTGVLNSVVAIDKNRGWKLVGGRNQVGRYMRILHACDEGAGWRPYVAWQAQSYYTTRMGFVSEVGTEGDADNAPLRALWSVDPVRCSLTGNRDKPLRYFPTVGGSTQEWLPRDFIRGASMGSTDEKQNGYGFPAIARCIDLARIMVAVYQHDNEQLGARAPRGLLLLNGISQETWDKAMEARDEKLNDLERQYFGGVAVLASSGANEVSAILMALSQLPKDFDTEKFTSLLMYGYALAFGYDPREFYPVSAGSLGTGRETETQHRKASSKGDLDFSLAYQEQLQNRLPATLQFEFEQRDVEGETNDADLQLKKAQVITEMTKWVVDTRSVLTSDQVMQLAAQAGVVPEEWTPVEEDVTTSDTDAEAARILQLGRVQRALRVLPREDIVEYSSRTNRTRTLIDRSRPQRRRSWPVAFIVARSVADVVQEYDDQLSSLTRQAMSGQMSATDMARAHRALIRTLGPRAYVEGLREFGVGEEDMDESDQATISAWTGTQLAYVSDFAKATTDAASDADKQAIDSRLALWLESMRTLGEQGKMSAKQNMMVTWQLGSSKEHCRTCKSNHQQRHRMKWFTSRGLIPREPGSESLECGGWECLCGLFDDSGTRVI